MYVCPHCQKQVKNLKSHIKRVHPNETSEATPEATPVKNPNQSQQAKAEAKEFKLNAPADNQTYKCGNCSAALDSEVSPCPHCGADLDWS